MARRSTRPTHDSIVAQVARLRRLRDEAPVRAAQAELAAILDHLNALDALDQLRTSVWSQYLSGGPLAVQGATPVPWVGAVIWQRAPGYFGYKTLTLVGLWALKTGEHVQLRAGTRRLAYALDFFEADAYHKRIRREFGLYYADDGAPPSPAETRWEAVYAPDQRLALRSDAATALGAIVC